MTIVMQILLHGEDLKITSFSELKDAAKYLYNNLTGRIIPHILIGIFMTTSTFVLKIINTILYIVLLIFISRFITRKNTYLSIVTAFGFFLYGTMFGEKFAWISRKFKLFVDNYSFNDILIQYLWIFCGKQISKKLAKNSISFSRIFYWFCP